MEKPKNPYKKGSLAWLVMQGSLDFWPEGGWADLGTREIAEVLNRKQTSVTSTITNIRRETGYDIPFRKHAR